MQSVIETACGLLEGGEGFVLATIVSQAGSTPRDAGTRMIVRSDGTLAGTIGGGLLEAEVIREAKECFRRRNARLRSFDLRGSTRHELDMLCGGALEILLTYIEPTDTNRALFQAIRDALRERRASLVVTDLGPEKEETKAARFCLARGRERVCGDFPHPDAWLSALEEEAAGTGVPTFVSLEGRRFVVEACVAPDRLYLFGAGHVSLAVQALASRVGFQTVVLDDRPEFANAARFPTADRVVVLDSFEEALAGLEIDRNSYLVIVTRGHSHDKTVLQQALRTPFGYVGMMGSRRKRETIYQALLREGFLSEELEKVHCPIGLEIGAEGPEEIAVSIVAELILVRSQKRAS